LTLSSKIFKVKEGQRSLAAFGSCVLVCFNHKTQTTHEVPLFWREILEKEMAANE
jgi:acyl-CoA thioesterase FadM